MAALCSGCVLMKVTFDISNEVLGGTNKQNTNLTSHNSTALSPQSMKCLQSELASVLGADTIHVPVTCNGLDPSSSQQTPDLEGSHREG